MSEMKKRLRVIRRINGENISNALRAYYLEQI